MRSTTGDRVQCVKTGALATIVHRYDELFVDVQWDEPYPTAFADGTPTTTPHSCMHISLLDPAGTPALFDLNGEW